MTDYKMDMRGDGMGEELEVDYFRSLYNGC